MLEDKKINMWIVLEGDDLKEQHRRFEKEKWRNNLFYIFLFVSFTVFFKKYGIPSRFDPAPIPVAWSEIVYIYIPISFLVSAGSVFLFGSLTGDSNKFKVVCHICGTERTDLKQTKCKCGGSFHSTRDMRYNI